METARTPRSSFPPFARRAPNGELVRVGGHYRIDSQIGRGGMGVVYAATDERTGERVALKMLRRDESSSSLQRRFRREFQTLAGLAHPRIVRAYDYGVDAVGPYYTMDLLDGQDLDALGRVEVGATCRILRDLASALAFLHARRLIHRDVKLTNVRLTGRGDAKLMDFGLLATSGIAPDDIVGTASYMAPECLRMGVLDHLVDLFALGAVAYRLLTGRAPFPTARFDELEDWWKVSPQPPSELAAGVPPALDALVLSLLCINPLGRPSSAAEVIDRVTAIGGLSHVPELDIARGYLASAALVGRESEMVRLRARLSSALTTRAESVTIEAASGEGKSRLLRELAIEAQLAGATIITVDCGAAGRAPFGVLRKIAVALHAADSPRTLRAASPRIGVIGRALPEIREHVTRTARDQPLGDPAEERLLLQAELAAFVLEAVAGRKVAIFLDDAQRCDEGSAVALAACARARQGKLFLACAVRTDEVARAADAIDAIRSGAERVILAGLTEEATLSFVDAAFGEVPNVARFARSLHAASGGSPIQITEVLRDLVDSGAVRYEGGLWHLPDELGAAHSRGLAGAMDARVAALPPDLRELAVSLAVHGASVSIETCLAVAGLDEETSLERAQLLIAAGFLAFADGLYKIRHDGFREALLRAMSPEEKRRVNLRVGLALEESGTSTPAQIGWHLLEGGEALRGAKLLEHSGRLAFDTQSFDDAVKMLEAALDVYEARNLHPKRCLELRQRIVTCGMHSSKVAFDRHALRVIDLLERASGVERARTLERLLPSPLAFLLGFAWAWLRWVFGGARRVPDPVTALTGYVTAVTYQGTVCAVSADLEGAHAAAARLEVFAWMKGRVPHAAYLLVRSFYTCQTGEWTLTRADMERALETLTTDKITPLRDVELRMAKGGAKFAVASLYAQDQQPLSLVWLEDLEGLGLRFFQAGAKVARVQYHRLRGEEKIASAIEREMELALLQGGSLWILEAQVQWVSGLAYAYTHDVVGMRRSIERLESLCARGLRYEPILDLVRAEHLRETGEREGVRPLIERCLATLPSQELRVREQALLAMAEAELADSAWEAADRWAKACLEIAARPETGRATPRLLATRTRALAAGGRGELAAARALLDSVEAEVVALGSPMMHVEMFIARAKIARWASDPVAADALIAAAKEWATRADNPALAARVELLVPPSSSSLAPFATRGDDVTSHGGGDQERSMTLVEPVSEARSRAGGRS